MKQLPTNPNIEFLRKQAKRLLSDFKLGKPYAIALVKQQNRTIAQINLRRTQNVIARSYGFNDWADLAMFVRYRRGGINMKNRINWFWIPVENLDRASMFYKYVLNCEVWSHKEDGFAVFSWEKGEVSGGLHEKDDDVGKPGSNGVRILLNCEGRLDDAISEVSKNGGEVINKCLLGDFGIQAIIKDTEGNLIHLHSFASKGAEKVIDEIS